MLTHNKLLFTFLVLFLVTVIVCDSENNVELSIKQGILSGKVDETFYLKKTYHSFRGVPFARPPVGELRFKPPTKHNGWEGVLEAHDIKPLCMQLNSKMRMGEDFGVSGSEDCLYLNIYKPQKAESLPVVVFDYNEGFRIGFNSTYTYSPDFFIEEDVIVVTIHHRLGLLGYLTTDDDVIPGNNGIRDFILGLQWIQENIDKFGGDPKRVTVMGSRSGAALVDILLHSDKAKGLFSAAILQSGTALESTLFHKTPRNKAFEFGELYNITTEDSAHLLEELQQLDATALVEQEHHVMDGGFQEDNYQLIAFPFGPVIERNHPDAILSSLPEELKVVNDVPVLIGFNSREGLDLAAPIIKDPRVVNSMAESYMFSFPIRTNYRFNKTSKEYEGAINHIKKFYLGGQLRTSNVLEYSVYMGDILQMYAERVASQKISNEIESPVFFYVFDFRGSLNENSEYITKHSRYALGKRGATITDELCYLHFCTRIKKTYKGLSKMVSEQPETKVLKKMVRMWTNFAKTRNPTPANDELLKDLQWKPIEKNSDDLDFLHITKKPQMKSNPFDDRMKFWDQFLESYRMITKDGVVTNQILVVDDVHEEL